MDWSSLATWYRQVKTMNFDDIDGALKEFGKKFKDKSGLSWDDRGEEPKKGKYVMLERNYEDDDEDDSGIKKEEDDSKDDVKSKLPVQTQRLMELIFNENHFNVSGICQDASHFRTLTNCRQ